ncbi:MAG TPA: YicC/YloC family endoribonuclease [Polyangia bacterium]|nr:YicC/YloC family endoribonuclease [Polyangia bacterium]
MSLLSMTGFGRGLVDAGQRRLRVEIRSVNHRGLDLKIRSGESDAFCDSEIARAVRAAIERGAVTVLIRDESAAASAGIDEARVRALYGVLERLRQELKIAEPVTLGTVGAYLGASHGAALSGESLWEVLRPAVEAALDELTAMRAREGAALAADLGARRSRLGELTATLRARAATLPEKFAQRLHERLAGQTGIEPGRLAQEVALMAERLDVTEELVRLETHLGHLGEILKSSGAVGRKLDFVVQEIGRELNTVASKAQDAEMAAVVIDAKAELEKLREQAQNVE